MAVLVLLAAAAGAGIVAADLVAVALEGLLLVLALGRFRNALILDEQSRRPNENLKKFIDQYALEGHEVTELKR